MKNRCCSRTLAAKITNDMPRIFAVRHGRTDWNAQGRVQGGGSLDQLGNLQIQALAERLKG